MFPTIRTGIGPSLKGLICGSAPLAIETQQFFMMLGIPVLQVYGLTETTAICTMDDPHHVTPGRVGPVDVSINVLGGEFHRLDAKEVTLVLSKPDSGIEPFTRAAVRHGAAWRIEDLITLPGVARKTANIVQGNSYPEEHRRDPDAGNWRP